MKANKSANVGILLYMFALLAGGITLLALTYLNEWGFMGYLGGGVLAVSGIGMLVGRAQGGVRFVDIVCPGCQTQQTYAEEALVEGRAAPCKNCLVYLRGNGEAAVLVPREEIAPQPMFEAPFPPKDLIWQQGCALCGGEAQRAEEIQGSVKQGRKLITRTITIPLCHQHVNQQAVTLGSAAYLPGEETFALAFRSYTASLRFREANPAATKVINALTFGRG